MDLLLSVTNQEKVRRMVFRIPPDSLALRYNDSHRQFTWEGVRGPSGIKIVPEIRNQIGPTCIYEAMAAWVDSLARLKGRICKISSKDIELKVEALMTETEDRDRTMKCIEVLKHIGVCSEDDFESQNPNATIYRLVGATSFMPLNEEHLTEAIRRMHETPLLLVFHVGSNYQDYLTVFQQRPVLSYKRFEEGKMQGHGVCAIGYGVEAVVPFWKFMNSCKKVGPTKGLGRVLPQNLCWLIAPDGLEIDEPGTAPPQAAAPPPPPAAGQSNLRKRKFNDEVVGTDVQPMKKQKVGP